MDHHITAICTASIADHAKTRQRNPKFSDIIELSDEEDDELSLQPKLKRRPKAKPKLKVKDKRGDTSNDKPLDISGTTETNTDKSLSKWAKEMGDWDD